MKWSEIAWQRAEKAYLDILKLQFINDLIKGTLSDERFKFYIIQDSLYIADYCKVLMKISEKLENPKHAETFKNFAEYGIEVEKALHSIYLDGHVPLKSEMSETCELYSMFLFDTLNKNIEISLAAVLPCFWIYQKVGDYIYQNAEKDNKYKDWISTYSAPEFAETTKITMEICDEMAEKCEDEDILKKMTDAFYMATILEWKFWDSAYKLEKNY